MCDLTVPCTCPLKVSEVNKSVLMSLISRLNDEDTKQLVLSEVEEMTLDNTFAFVEARETGKNSVKILSGGGLTSGQANRVHEKEVAGDLGKCKYCGRKGHGKSPNYDLKKASCAAFDNKFKKCNRNGQYQDFCTWKKDPKKGVSEDSKKTTASGNKVMVNRMEMMQTKGKVLGISQQHKVLMKNQQNMTKLRHETWCEKTQSYKKSDLTEEPTLKLRMNLDIKAYAKHSPPLQCTVQRKWMDSLVDKKQFDIVLKKSTADTGAQCFLLGADHLPDLGLSSQRSI